MKLFERSSKDSAIIRRDFEKKRKAIEHAQRHTAAHDTRAGGVADDDVAVMNHAHDALALDARSRHHRRADDDAAAASRQRAVMKITAYDDDDDDDDDENNAFGGDDEDDDDGEDGYVMADEGEDAASEEAHRARTESQLDGVARKWGGNTAEYYNTDYHDEEHSTSDEEDAIAEEQEVARLERRKARLLSADDFGATADDGADEPRGADAGKSVASGPQTDAELVARLDAELDEIDFDLDAAGDEMAVERVDRDISSMTAEQKVEALEADAPELLQLLDDFCESVDELINRLAPVVELAREAREAEGGDADVEGISFLDVKFHLLLNYCTNVAFYLLLKAEGRTVRDHPVILQLVKTRTLLEKLRPLDKKLGYQIEKLLKLAQSIESGDSDQVQAAVDAVSADPLRFKPRAALLMDDDGQVDEDDAAKANGRSQRRSRRQHDEDEDEDEDDEEVQDEAPTGGKYVPPRHVAVPYDDDAGAKKTRNTERDRRRAVQSEMAKAVLAEFGDEPEEEMEVHGGAYDEIGQNAKEREMRDYEEDNFVRLMLSKKEQKARGLKLRNELKVLDDFVDIGAFEGVEELAPAADPAAPKDRQRSLSQLVSSLDQKSRAIAATLAVSADADAPYRAKARNLPSVVDDAAADDDDNDNDDKEPALEDNPVYNKALAQHAGKKRGADDALFQSRIAIDEDAKRSIGKRIEKNRGLVRPRNEKRKTPRAGLRNKHGDAIKRRKGAVPTMRAEEGPYEGEHSGVKASVVRSRQLTR